MTTSSQAPSLRWPDALQSLTRPARRPPSERDQAVLSGAQRFDRPFEQGHLTQWHWGDHGPHVLLVHGWESRAAHWHAWIRPLLQAGFQVTAVDLPAHGASTGDETDVVQCSRAVLALYQSIPNIEAMIGHSMGSAACLYAFAHGAQVKASIHLAGPSSLSRVIAYTAHMSRLDRTERDALYAAMNDRTGNSVDQMDPPALQIGMRHDALIFHDPQDPEMPYRESEDLHQHWNRSELTPLPGVGHRQILKHEATIAQSVNWILKQTASAQAA